MTTDAWSHTIARDLLEEPLPRRWAHTQGVAATARALVPILGEKSPMVIAAAWLHDIGYAPSLHDTGFHPLDGARYLRDTEHADPLVCRLVAHHSCAVIEAAERGLAAELARDFHPAPQELADALIYCDMTTGPSGQRVAVAQRLDEIRARYGDGHVVSRSINRSGPDLAAAVGRVQQRLARHAPVAHLIRPALATVLSR